MSAPFSFFAGHAAGASRRTGVVHAVGRCWADDQGLFHPLGATFFWALHGWHEGDQARVRQTVEWLQRYRVHYLRMLGQWLGAVPIDPDWPDYEQSFGGLIDMAYDTYGMRTLITASGGGARDPLDLARKVTRIVSARPHKVLYIEAANEAEEARR